MKRKTRLFEVVHRRTSLRTAGRAQFFLFAVLVLSPVLSSVLSPTPARAQGCTQCLDNTAATPPKTQAAYRHAILFMTIAGGSIFVGAILLLKRNR